MDVLRNCGSNKETADQSYDRNVQDIKRKSYYYLHELSLEKAKITSSEHKNL